MVSQLVRSPGVYFESTLDKVADKDVFVAKIIPSRGAWLEFEVDKKDMVAVRVDRKRKQPVTVLLKALGLTNEEILERFGQYESIRATLEKDRLPLKKRPCSTSTASCVQANRRRWMPRAPC